jgi:hypothetical protein
MHCELDIVYRIKQLDNVRSTCKFVLLVLHAITQEMVQKTAKADPRREEWIVSMMKQDGVSREVSPHT